MLNYKIAPPEWNTDEINPFASDGQFGNSWSCFSTRGSTSYRYFTGRSKSGCWQLKYGQNNEEYKSHIIDFIRYENANGRTVILDTEFGQEIEILIKALIDVTPFPGIIRKTDPEYVLHSTSIDAWNKIKTLGEITAAAFLRERWNFDDSESETAKYIKNEPPEYKECVMFGGIGGGFTEIVVASYQKKKMICDENVEYTPGARLYIQWFYQN